jgi:hypothetical protein
MSAVVVVSVGGLRRVGAHQHPRARTVPLGSQLSASDCSRLTRPATEVAYSPVAPTTLPVFGLTRWTCRQARHVND